MAPSSKTMTRLAALTVAALGATTEAVRINFQNQCSYTINLYDNARVEDIAPGGSTGRDVGPGFHGMYRHGVDPQATLAEFTIDGMGIWYDLSAVRPGSGNCNGVQQCKQATPHKGYNVPIAINPSSPGAGSCKAIVCASEDCPDAYLYPSDDSKTHNCPISSTMNVVFCPGGSGGNGGGSPQQQQPAATVAPAPIPAGTPAPAPSTASNPWNAAGNYESGVLNPAGQSTPSSNGGSGKSFPGATIKSSFTYRGKDAGNVQGTYQMVTSTDGCKRETVTVQNPVGPIAEEITYVYRGPMDIFNIAIFDGQAGGDWTRVSSYNRDAGTTDNMIFMNNLNVDYNTGKKSPQGFASADGTKVASQPQIFKGKLADASNPAQQGGGPGVQTGAEINIMTSKKCAGDCKGYADDNGYHGWGGGKKMMVTKVQMGNGGSPNRPAIWALNAQIVRSNQYQCNCRGMGGIGGCGELDIVEVIETNAQCNRMSTHYYFLQAQGSGKDNFAPRPFDAPTTYITIIDDSGEGTIKILEIGGDDFDFSATSISNSQIQSWLAAADK